MSKGSFWFKKNFKRLNVRVNVETVETGSETYNKNKLTSRQSSNYKTLRKRVLFEKVICVANIAI